MALVPPKQSSDRRLVFHMTGCSRNPLPDPEQPERSDRRRRSTHNENVLAPHRDDGPVHSAKQLGHNFLDVVVGEGLQCRDICVTIRTLYLHTSSKGHATVVRHGKHKDQQQQQQQEQHLEPEQCVRHFGW